MLSCMVVMAMVFQTLFAPSEPASVTAHARNGAERTLEVAWEPAVRSVFTLLLHRAQQGDRNAEVAAFIVRTAQGTISFVPWSCNGEADFVTWEGRYPPGVIAIAHTHPSWLPLPSGIDRQTASRTRLPVYVITQTGITRTIGQSAELVLEEGWTRQFE